ncbi:MAG TPA: RNA polymerase sigma factor [Polyangiaceae bacterium]|nr:RNA polymerase sigma factor [Polyangiaceae bacterium]
MSDRSARPTLDMSAIFDEHFDYVWSALRRLGVRDADVEDLVHEVFLKIHLRSADYDDTRPVRPWIFGFAYRVAADYRRLARHRVEVLHAPTDTADPQRPVDEQIAAAEDRALLESALGAVDVDRRAIFLLHDVEGVPVPEIATTLGVPLNTAYSRLRLAREEFAAAAKRFRRAREAP